MTALVPAAGLGELTEAEARYVQAARAPNTRRGYRSDWADFTAWCAGQGTEPLPAAPETVTGYVLALVGSGRKVSTVSRHLSSISSAHRLAGLPSPTDHPRVRTVWEGVRRVHQEAAGKAPPLMPPVLWDVIDRLPDTAVGHRDAALLLVGFVGALRRSEISAARVEDLAEHPRGRVLTLPTSKTDQHGEGQLVVLPRSGRPEHCPVAALDRWLEHAGDGGPLFRAVHRSGKILAGGLAAAAVNEAVQRACTVALGEHGFSAHSLRAGFVTYAAARGASDRAIARQTRHLSLAMVARYTRHESAWVDNAATALDL